MTMAHSNKKIISYRSKLRGGHILNGQIIVKNGIIEGTKQIYGTMYVREFCWVCEALQLSTGQSNVPLFLYSRTEYI